MTQKEMAKIFGVGERHYRRIENGDNDPPLKTAIRIALTFNLKVEDLWDGYVREFSKKDNHQSHKGD